MDIKTRRKELGIRAKSLAYQLGIHYKTLCELESGRRKYSPGLYKRIYEILL